MRKISRILLKGGFEPINVKFRKLVGIHAAIYLSFLLSKQNIYGERFFFGRHQFYKAFNTENDPMFTQRKLLKAEKLLIALKLINKKKIGMPARNHYTVNEYNLKTFLKKTRKYLKTVRSNKMLSTVETIRNNYENYKERKAKPQLPVSTYSTDLSVRRVSTYIDTTYIDINSSFKKTKEERHFKQSCPKGQDKHPCSSEEQDCLIPKKLGLRWKKKPKDKVLSGEIPFNPFISMKVSPEAYLVYNKLVELGATKHKTDNKVFAQTMESLHRLLSSNCKNPYSSILKGNNEFSSYEYKKWTPNEIIGAFRKHIEKSNIKSISVFIYNKYVKSPVSSLLDSYLGLQDQNYDLFNGTAKKIMHVVEKVTGDRTVVHPKLYINSGILVDKLEEKYAVPPGRITPEDQVQFHFLQFLKGKLNKIDFPVHIISSDKFITEFVKTATRQGSIRNKKDLMHRRM